MNVSMYVVGASFSLASLHLHFSSNNVDVSATNVRKKSTCKFALFDAAQRVELLSNGAFLLTLDLKIKFAINQKVTKYNLTRFWILCRPNIRENYLHYTN